MIIKHTSWLSVYHCHFRNGPAPAIGEEAANSEDSEAEVDAAQPIEEFEAAAESEINPELVDIDGALGGGAEPVLEQYKDLSLNFSGTKQ